MLGGILRAIYTSPYKNVGRERGLPERKFQIGVLACNEFLKDYCLPKST